MKNIVSWKWPFGKNKEAGNGGSAVNLWEDVRNDPWPSLWGPAAFSSPSVDVSESANAFSVKAELPGLTEKDIVVTWQNGTLSISGEKKEEKEEKGKNRYHKECRYGSFHRNFLLGENADWEKANAKYKRGVLTVHIPKKKESSTKVIEVN